MNGLFAAAGACAGDLVALEGELREGLLRFFEEAARVLAGGAIRLSPPEEDDLAAPRNLFSFLFLYSYHRAGIPAARRVSYAAMNQCLRGMVTGCDNLLDDEYKPTLRTDLPGNARRFRSVLDIMVADRVLAALAAAHCAAHGRDPGLALEAGRASLLALAASGAQEASEEGGIGERPPPETVLATVHHAKTGVLFESVWAIPDVLEERVPPGAGALRAALYDIGIGCQMLDDLCDLFVDLREERHNLVASTVLHREPPAVRARMEALLAAGEGPRRFYAGFPDLEARLRREALDRLHGGLAALFAEPHRGLARPVADILAARIGGDTGRD